MQSIDVSLKASKKAVEEGDGEIYLIEYETHNYKVASKYWYRFTIDDPFKVAECRADFELALQKCGGKKWRQMKKLLNGE